METPSQQSVTTLLQAAAAGDSRAAGELLPLLYEELRRLARARMAHAGAGNTLQPTALVHEAFLRLVGNADPGWNNRGHFFAAAALAMRQILVEQARRKASLKRGGDRQRLALTGDRPTDAGSGPGVEAVFQEPVEDVLALHEAIERLERYDPRKAQIVNLRYFAGLTAEETAAAMGLSLGTIEREWRYIRARLRRDLGLTTEPSGRAVEGSSHGDQ